MYNATYYYFFWYVAYRINFIAGSSSKFIKIKYFSTLSTTFKQKQTLWYVIDSRFNLFYFIIELLSYLQLQKYNIIFLGVASFYFEIKKTP